MRRCEVSYVAGVSMELMGAFLSYIRVLGAPRSPNHTLRLRKTIHKVIGVATHALVRHATIADSSTFIKINNS